MKLDGKKIIYFILTFCFVFYQSFQVKLPRYASKHLEIKRELRKMDDRAFFLDVVKDIANDLDLKSLTKKITENIAVLLDAEAASLFLVEGPKGKQSLVSKVRNMAICLLYAFSGKQNHYYKSSKNGAKIESAFKSALIQSFSVIVS